MTTPEISTYQHALDYLYSFIDFEKRPPPDRQAAQHNIERTRELLVAVGSPEQSFSSVVVAGTKGKGSTSAILESIVRTAGYRTGLWTSPHLNSYRERIQVNRQLIPQSALIDAVRRLVPVVEQFDSATYGIPTTFELGFALALRYFAEQQVRLAVLEVGLGGRYDCANAVTPLLSLVSSISYDHNKQLGNTLTEIAYQKAGIFKPHVEAITVPQAPEAMQTLREVASEVKTPLWLADHKGIERVEFQGELTRQVFSVKPVPALRGSFQRENAALALGAIARLRPYEFGISDTMIQEGLRTVQWPGRLEVAGLSPLIVLDGAHNGDSAQKLAVALRAEFRFERLLLVLGMSHDKQVDDILKALMPHADGVVLTRSRHPRAHSDLDKIAGLVRLLTGAELLMTGDIPEALDRVRELARPTDLICVTGSLFVVGAAREALGLASDCD